MFFLYHMTETSLHEWLCVKCKYYFNQLNRKPTECKLDHLPWPFTWPFNLCAHHTEYLNTLLVIWKLFLNDDSWRTLAEVSNHPTKPFSWQNCSILMPLLVRTSLPWSHLLASNTATTCLPLDKLNLASRSSFHFVTASNVDGRVTSKTMKTPMASR